MLGTWRTQCSGPERDKRKAVGTFKITFNSQGNWVGYLNAASFGLMIIS